MKRSTLKHRRVTRRSELSEFPSDSLWRAAVMDAGNWRCVACGCLRMTQLQADHIIPRSQGGLSDLSNGLILCRTCHEAKTESRLQIKHTWLRSDQLRYLAEHHWVEWVATDAGLMPFGRGWRHFC